MYCMTPLEAAWGWVAGGEVVPPPAHDDRDRTPLEALEDVIRPALSAPPCLVEFSGGRDSSLVLAVALGLARREGLPLPVAVTRRFPGVADADESRWQEAVAAWIGLEDWEIRQLGTELDLLGPAAQRSLTRHGLLWPTGAHTRWVYVESLGARSVLTGDGGDEVFGALRAAPLRRVVSRVERLDRRTIRRIAPTLAPRRVRLATFRRQYARSLQIDWLRPEAFDGLVDALASDTADEPLDWRVAVQRHPRVRGVHLAVRNFEGTASEIGLAPVHPLMAPEFLAALARRGGRLGFASRTHAMRSLFDGLLPDEVLARESKAYFNHTIFGGPTRAFIASWTGEGIDEDLVDGDALRRTWEADKPHGMSSALLQSCWLASRGSLRV